MRSVLSVAVAAVLLSAPGCGQAPDQEPQDPVDDDFPPWFEVSPDPFVPFDAGRLTIEPPSVEIGAGGEGELITIAVTNTGGRELQVDHVALEASSDELILADAGDLPALLHPGDELLIWLAYYPVDSITDEGELSVHTDDPDEPVTVVGVVGTPDLVEVVESGAWIDPRQVDILWAIDFGSFMQEPCDRLATAVVPFMEDLQAADVDFQMAVMSVYHPDLMGEPPYVTADDPDAALTVADIIDNTPHDGGTEQGLANALTALLPPATDPGGAHEGFLRPRARLQLNYYVNEDDQSTHAVEQYVEELAAVVGDIDDLMINCVGIPPDDRHCQAATQTGGRVAHIGTADLDTEIAGYAARIEDATGTVPLEAVPLEETLEVEVDGEPALDGWSYDSEDNEIVFDEAVWPEVGAPISVVFQILA